jgi:hypothetical protein
MSRNGLVPVKKMVSRKGKPFMQTFYVRPDQAPKKPSAIHHLDLPALPAPAMKGPRGDNRFYISRPKEGEFDKHGIAETEAVRLPEKAILGTFEKYGQSFVLHKQINQSNKISSYKMSITEVRSGKQLMSSEAFDITPEAFKKDAITKLEAIGEEKVKSVISSKDSVMAAKHVIEDTDDFYMTTPISKADIKLATDHIMKVIMDDDDAGIRQMSVDWIKEHLETNEDIEIFINDTSNNNEEEFRIALAGEMDMIKATETLRALVYIEENITPEDYSISYDDIKKWWEKQDKPELRETEVWNFGDSNDYGEVEEGEALYEMVHYSLSIKETEEWVQEKLEGYEEESGETDIDDFEMTDRNDIEWTGEALKYIGEWVDGSVVKGARKLVKEEDTNRRAGLGPESVAYNNIGETVISHMIYAEYDELYRGTSNDAWKEAQIGDIMPLGMASFSNKKVPAEGFASGGGTLIILKNSIDGDDTSKRIQGIDLDQLIEDVVDESDKAVSDSGISQHQDEHEFIVRSPSIKITKLDNKVGGYHIVYAEVHEMDLLKSMQMLFSDDADRIARMEATFDEPLHREKT